MGIKKKISQKIEKVKSKRIERKLIKGDDETVVEALTSDEDNSNLDIKKIVSNMDNPENMAVVVNNNLEEIIQQDNVRDTLQFLPDEEITEIVEENETQLKEEHKMANAILSMKGNKEKLEYLNKNLSLLTDVEIQRVLRSLKTGKDNSEMEKQKIQIIGKKVFENIKKYGSAFHLLELTESLSEEAKKDLFNCCLQVFVNNENNSKLNPKAKMRFAEKYSSVIDLDLEQYIENGLLTQEEVLFIESEKERKQQKKDEREKNSRYGKDR